MGIKKIKISNFKSFKDLEVNLNNFNIVIGANASGKSNFIHIFEFLRDIVNHGLDNAISMQGDIEYLRNVNIGNTKNFSMEITTDFEEDGFMLGKVVGKDFIGIKPSDVHYKFTLELQKGKQGLKIIDDKLSIKFELVKLYKGKQKGEKVGDGTFSLIRNNGKIEPEFNIPPNLGIDKNDIFPFPDDFFKLKKRTLLIKTPFFRIPFDIADILQGVSVYNFDPKSPKMAIPITGKTELEEDGSNLAIALKKILKDKDSKKQFSNIINDVLSFVENLDVQKFVDRYLLVRLKETYSNKYLPAFLLSDGTLNIIALIIALYFGEKPLVIIEEPERNIHPHLISKVVEMMREVSDRKQIIVTTHNPEILKHARLEDILFIARDKEGFSQVTRPAENEQVKIFLENEMGIDELYVQNLLEL